MTTIKDIEGNRIEVTNLRAAIQQCIECSDSPYKMASGHTVGENHRYMLEQLKELQKKEQEK
ncbi:NADH-quinone oxidoreductase subunit F [Dysgonomonas sp. 521]|uniref:NADH-quinone oxidoreductase subunit F n=1 Tax=Dysgonomonas sp. 521 TaxID=2302932 RepID=UPI0013D0EF74|nr:NADH-quinone oxidoreductase subunit F [Dysgonomonas sp. 521]NDV93431.1 NADH-quinone oxidoreductase subunit F [Dysgonomonas sp. 521]